MKEGDRTSFCPPPSLTFSLSAGGMNRKDRWENERVTGVEGGGGERD